MSAPMGRAAKWILTNGAAWRFPGSSTTRHRAASRGASRRLTADTIIAATGAQRRPRPNATGKRRHGRRFQRSHNPRDQALNLIRDGRNSGTSPPMLELASAPLINEDPPRVARPCPSIPLSPHRPIHRPIHPSVASFRHPSADPSAEMRRAITPLRERRPPSPSPFLIYRALRRTRQTGPSSRSHQVFGAHSDTGFGAPLALGCTVKAGTAGFMPTCGTAAPGGAACMPSSIMNGPGPQPQPQPHHGRRQPHQGNHGRQNGRLNLPHQPQPGHQKPNCAGSTSEAYGSAAMAGSSY